jgi:hypothetical protein
LNTSQIIAVVAGFMVVVGVTTWAFARPAEVVGTVPGPFGPTTVSQKVISARQIGSRALIVVAITGAFVYFLRSPKPTHPAV